MVTPVLVFDATHDNIGALRAGAQVAGYTTGTGTHIRWTDADFAAHPGAVRIDQDPAASDPTADVLDIEAGAATPASAPGWVTQALASRAGQARPGQRARAVYMSQSGVTEVVNALIAGGISSGVGLWIAHFGLTQAQATQMVINASGPFPVIGVQFRNTPAFDVSVFSSDWLATGGQQSPTVPAWETAMMNALPTLQQGAQDRPGRGVLRAPGPGAGPRDRQRQQPSGRLDLAEDGDCSGRLPLRRSRRCSGCSASPRTASSDRRPGAC